MRSRSLNQHDWLGILNDRQKNGNFETRDVPKWVIRTLRKNKYLANNNVVTKEGADMSGYGIKSLIYGEGTFSWSTSATITAEAQETIQQVQDIMEVQDVDGSITNSNTDPL